MAGHRRQLGRRRAAVRQQPGGAEVGRQAHGDAAAAGDQRMARRRLADRQQMRIRHRVDDGVAPAAFLEAGHCLADRPGALLDHGEGHQCHGAVGLAGQHAHQVGVLHRGQRVVLHAALVQQRGADEQVPLVDCAAVGRECRVGQGEAAAQALDQRIRHRADVAGLGAVEGRAVLEEDLLGPGGEQRLAGGQALGHRLAWRRGAGLQRDDDGIGLGQRPGRHADHLHRGHAAFHQGVRKVGGAGEIIGDAAEQRHGGVPSC